MSTLVRIAFDLSTPSSAKTTDVKIDFLDPELNDSQKEAIKFAIASPEIALIHGPPGVCERMHDVHREALQRLSVLSRLEKHVH